MCRGINATVSVFTDYNPQVISWYIQNKDDGAIVAQRNDFSERLYFYSDDVCLDSMGCYRFTIIDEWGDGLVQWKDGHFELIVDGVTLLEDNDEEWYSLESRFFGDGCLPTMFPSFAPLSPSNSPTVCVGLPVTVLVRTDQFPEQTSWSITNKDDGAIVAQRSDFSVPFYTYLDDLCLDSLGCYKFTIFDSFANGLMLGNGQFELIVDGVTLLKDNNKQWFSLESDFFGGGCS